MHPWSGTRTVHAACVGLIAFVFLASSPWAAEAVQSPPGPDAWFGVPLPPGLQPHVPPAIIGDRGPRPALVPLGEERHHELEGATIRDDLETIVDFSRESRARREVGDGQLWGRITGLPSGAATVAWAAEQFRAAGISDVSIQAFDQEDDASFWLPLQESEQSSHDMDEKDNEVAHLSILARTANPRNYPVNFQFARNRLGIQSE